MESYARYHAKLFAAATLFVVVACGSDESPDGGLANPDGGADVEAGGAGGSAGTGGSSGTSGSGGHAGVSGGAGVGGIGGGAGNGGSAGVAGSGGAAGTAGTAGTAGGAGSAGMAGASGAAGTSGGSGAAGAAGSGPTDLRIVAANLTSGNLQSYDPGHGARILEALKPDVVLIQEFNYGDNTVADIRSFVTTTFGAEFSYVRENGQIPNGVISRYPILQSGEWDDPEVSNRDFVWARIDLPGPADLWAISVHLLTSQPGDRNKEANALIGFMSQIPSGELVVLGGDFNTNTRSEGCVSALSARFETDAPYPVDQDDNANTNAFRNNPYDWVVASPELHAMAVPVQIGSQSFPNGLVFDSRVYTPLSDVPPVLIDDSDASQMQHMAVVRNFVVP